MTTEEAERLARLPHIIGGIVFEIENREEIDESREWIGNVGPAPVEVERSATHAIGNYLSLMATIAEAEDTAHTYATEPLYRETLEYLAMMRSLIGEQADAPATWALRDGDDAHAVQIIRDALAEGVGYIAVGRVLAARLRVDVDIKFRAVSGMVTPSIPKANRMNDTQLAVEKAIRETPNLTAKQLGAEVGVTEETARRVAMQLVRLGVNVVNGGGGRGYRIE